LIIYYLLFGRMKVSLPSLMSAAVVKTALNDVG
jgi:hypothetical protein